jgi:hypothetical protein
MICICKDKEQVHFFSETLRAATPIADLYSHLMDRCAPDDGLFVSLDEEELIQIRILHKGKWRERYFKGQQSVLTLFREFDINSRNYSAHELDMPMALSPLTMFRTLSRHGEEKSILFIEFRRKNKGHKPVKSQSMPDIHARDKDSSVQSAGMLYKLFVERSISAHNFFIMGP